MNETNHFKSHGVQMNSIIRALKVLEVLRENTDFEHKLTSEQLLRKVREADASCTEKTLRSDLKNLMNALNPVRDEYEDPARRGEFRIIHDGMEEGRMRLSGLRYLHEFTNDDLELLIELLRGSNTVNPDQQRRIETNLKKLGSKYYQYHADTIRNIPQVSTVDTSNLRENLSAIHEAVTRNVQLSFTFNRYGKNGKLVPVRADRYVANPYYVVCYGLKYYLLATHRKYEDVHIYRLDLMSDAQVTDLKRETIRNVRELNSASVKEYLEKHINANYSEPRTVTLSVQYDGYTQLHDQFGDKYIVKRAIDAEHDEVEVTGSGEGVVDWAILNMERIEILRPKSLRKRVQEKAGKLLEKYDG